MSGGGRLPGGGSELEGRFFPKEEGAEPDEEAGQTEPEKGLGQPEAGAAVSASDTTPQTFAPDAVSPAVFEAIYRWMEESYLKDNAKQPDGEGGPVKAAPIHRCLVFLSSCLRTEVPETGKMTTITWTQPRLLFQ